jgi:hypothetical protein
MGVIRMVGSTGKRYGEEFKFVVRQYICDKIIKK